MTGRYGLINLPIPHLLKSDRAGYAEEKTASRKFCAPATAFVSSRRTTYESLTETKAVEELASCDSRRVDVDLLKLIAAVLCEAIALSATWVELDARRFRRRQVEYASAEDFSCVKRLAGFWCCQLTLLNGCLP